MSNATYEVGRCGQQKNCHYWPPVPPTFTHRECQVHFTTSIYLYAKSISIWKKNFFNASILHFFNYIIFLSYRAFHGFEQTKFAYGGSISGLSQFTLLPKLPQKMMLNLKVVKIDSKKMISHH